MRGRLFQPGVEGVAVEAAVAGNDLVVEGEGASLRWPLDGVTFTLGGTEEGHLVVAPRATPGVELYLERAGLVAALEAQGAPPWFVDQVRGMIGASRRRWALGRSLLLAVVVTLAVGAGLLVLQARTMALAAVPIAWEEAVGQAAWDEHRLTTTPAADPALQAFVEETARRLVATRPERPPYDFSFHVVRDPAVNAFAFPGGVVVVNTGLLAAAGSPDEVAGVLAHELAHVLRRHSLEAALDKVGVLVAVGVFLDARGSLLELQTAMSLLDLKFSRDHERDADAVGLEMLHEAGLDPGAAGRFFERLAREQGDLPGALALLSTHPASVERADELARRAAALPTVERVELATPERWAALQAAARE